MPDVKLPEGLNGFCDERFAEVADVLARQLAEGEHHGAAFAAYFKGEPVVDIWGGSRNLNGGEAPWEHDTMTVCWSTTKGIMATALHMAMERHHVDLDTPVASVWPEFGRNGKDSITIRHVLCHEAGVPQIRNQIEDASEMSDWDHMVSVMENLTPMWEPGTASGYHAINYGWLAGEVLRRIDGRDVPTFLADELADPLGLDGLFIGTPEEELQRVAPLIYEVDLDALFRDAPPSEDPRATALAAAGQMGWLNSPAGYAACVPSISGVFTARSLARVYSAWACGGTVDGVRLLDPETMATATKVQSERQDRVISGVPSVRWRLGFMSANAIRSVGPNPDGFGHVGAGGTLGAADPTAQVAFGLIYDKWGTLEFLGGPRSVAMSHATVAAAEAAR